MESLVGRYSEDYSMNQQRTTTGVTDGKKGGRRPSARVVAPPHEGDHTGDGVGAVNDSSADSGSDSGKKRNKAGKGDGTDSRPDLSEKSYSKEMRRLHIELVKLQLWVQHKGLKVVVVFEGRDGAGKGGTIKALTERVSPRVFRVVALPSPTEREKSQMYLQRYVKHLPAAGEVVIFDRSWYNRAGVERVMGFCRPEQSERFLLGTPMFERTMVDSGIILLKYWLEVSAEEQERRLRDRIDDGRKIWKLSPMDIKSFSRWDEYTRARDEMFKATDTSWAPWFVARSESKKRVRLNVIKHLLDHVPYEKLPTPAIKLPKRKIGRYKPADYPFRMVPEIF
jgi:polyphosphate kinase 2